MSGHLTTLRGRRLVSLALMANGRRGESSLRCVYCGSSIRAGRTCSDCEDLPRSDPLASCEEPPLTDRQQGAREPIRAELARLRRREE